MAKASGLYTMSDNETAAEQLRSSSALTFARSLFHAAEGNELFEHEFAFASAVSTYYSIFHLGGALILAYCSYPAPTGDPHSSLRNKLEKKCSERRPRTLSNRRQYLPDPAGLIDHKDVPPFLMRELPEIGRVFGARDQRGTLMDMREFVSYAPRMVNDGHINVLYSGCQYEAHDFQDFLRGHLRQIDQLFCEAVVWLGRGYEETCSRIVSGDFVLFEFAELRAYHPQPVAKRAFEIYRSICDQVQVNWRIWRPDLETFYTDESLRREQYAKAVSSFQ